MKQDDRDLLLYNLENNKVSNEDLFLYDLTSYYNFDSNDEKLFDKILKYKKDSLRMKHNSNISFTPQQYDLYKKIIIPGKYAVSATTSFGKTTIIKEYIKSQNPNIVIYVVPTNSLADELLHDFSRLFPDYSIIDTSVKEKMNLLNEKIIFIGTQEKLSDIKWFKEFKIDLFVIDEAYKLSDTISGYREVSLNRIFVDYISLSSTSILLLPLVNNIEGLEKFDIDILKYSYSPVAKKYEKIDTEQFEEKIINSINLNKDKNLVYFDSPTELENFFWNNEQYFSLEKKYNDKWIQRVENDFHPDWLPVIAYKRGICIHHGCIPKFIQIMMTKKFNADNNYNTILSTCSLIEGVNTPTKNIFINDKKILSKKNQIKFKNLIGRAGRLNVTPVGYVYYNSLYEENFKIANEDWKNINLKIVLEDEEQVDDINRTEMSERLQEISKKYNILVDDLKTFAEDSGISISKLDIFVEKIQKFQLYYESNNWLLDNTTGLVSFYEKCHLGTNSLFGLNVKVKSENELKIINNSSVSGLEKNAKYNYYRKLFSASINNNVGKYNTTSIKNMVTYITENLNMLEYKMNKSMIVSSIIKMVYTFLPYELIPLIENVITLNDIFKKNNQNLLCDDIINKLQIQLNKYNLKYYGTFDSNDKLKKIIKRLFEYGIPFNVISDDLNYISEELNDSFSIIDIKKIIYNNDSLISKYEKYFE